MTIPVQYDSKSTDLISVKNATKHYHGVTALDDVSVAVPYGEVLGLVGENGAGKSTLLKVLAGVVVPDSGSVIIEDAVLGEHSVAETRQRGIAMVHQELTLFPDLSVAQNIFIGMEFSAKSGLVDQRRAREESFKLLRKVGATVDPSAIIRNLPLATQTLVEVAKAIAWDPRLLILDEATSALDGRQVETLFSLVAEMKARGTSTIFVSHRIGEVLQISDTVLTLRDGKAVGRFRADDGLSEGKLLESMTGRESGDIFPEKRTTGESATNLLEISNLSTGRLDSIGLAVKQGEILGLGGLQGHGQQELLQAAFGARPVKRGFEIKVHGKKVRRPSPRQLKKRGVVYVPPDRKSEGLLLPHSVEMNLLLSSLDRLVYTVLGIVSRSHVSSVRQKIRAMMRISQRHPHQPIETLSGGNQQKVLIGRWVERKPAVLLLDEATRGVDVSTKMEIYTLLRKLADDGCGILFASTESAELLGLCDRIVVIYDGAIHRELTGESVNEYELTSATLGFSATT